MDNQVFGHIFVSEIVVIILAVNEVAFSNENADRRQTCSLPSPCSSCLLSK